MHRHIRDMSPILMTDLVIRVSLGHWVSEQEKIQLSWHIYKKPLSMADFRNQCAQINTLNTFCC